MQVQLDAYRRYMRQHKYMVLSWQCCNWYASTLTHAGGVSYKVSNFVLLQ